MAQPNQHPPQQVPQASQPGQHQPPPPQIPQNPQAAYYQPTQPPHTGPPPPPQQQQQQQQAQQQAPQPQQPPPPHPMQYPVQSQQHPPHPYMQYQAHPHYYPQHMQMHHQQTGPMYSAHPPPPTHQPHWVTHGPPPPHPSQAPPPQHMMPQPHPTQQMHHPSQPTYYQTAQPVHLGPQPQQPQPQPHQPQQQPPHLMQYQVHGQQHPAQHPAMGQNPYMQYPAHPHYYTHHMPIHAQQAGPLYSTHPPTAPPPPPTHTQHPQAPPPPQHWVPHGPHPQQPPMHSQPPHMMPQHHMQPMSHNPPPPYYPPPPTHMGPVQHHPQQASQALPPTASPHHQPSRTHTPQQLPSSQTPTRVPPPSSTPASPSAPPSLNKSDKKDIIFPKNSVEATKPIPVKKRKITSKDVNDIEVWRLLMCLKSGLLAESSWAIDVLGILLNDDSTHMYFQLQHMPGLLEAVLEHFKCCLNELFDGIMSDTTLKPTISEKKVASTAAAESVLPTIKKENGVTSSLNNNDITTANNNNTKSTSKTVNGTSSDHTSSNNNNNNNNNNNSNNNTNSNNTSTNNTKSSKSMNKRKTNGIAEEASSCINIPSHGDQITIFNSTKNYTFRTRDGRVVKLENGVDSAPRTEGSTHELIYEPVGYSHWQEGKGEDTSHIQVHFEHDNFIESSKRCTCISTIVRNLSFIPGNDVEMSKHAGLLLVLGRLLLLKHQDVIYNEPESAPNEWHLLDSLREDTLVIISNISSSLDLSPYNDKINLSLLDGLLHWACCSSSYALDPFPVPSGTVSPQRLALESLAKLSIIEGNVDLILATPPWSRIEKLFEVLARLLNINEDQTVREFSLVLLSNLTSADSGIARQVALTGSAIPRLISFLETSLADPETFSTTQDMLRRAALTLKCLSQLVDNHPLFAQHQQRLLNLVMSQKLDREVVPIIADVIFEISLSD